MLSADFANNLANLFLAFLLIRLVQIMLPAGSDANKALSWFFH